MQRKIHLTLAVVASSLVFWGCDTTAVFSTSYVQFDPEPFQIMGAQPIRETESGFVPACRRGEKPDGFKVNFILKSSKNKGKYDGNKDRLVREGDRIDNRQISIGPGQAFSAQNFSFNNGNNSNNSLAMTTFSKLGNARPAADAGAMDLRFVARNSNRSESVAVALLIDNSGSMRGSVDPSRFFETKSSAFLEATLATDGTSSRFSAAGLGLISKLNPSDEVIAWSYNEKGVRLLCDLGDPSTAGVNDEPSDAADRECFNAPLSSYYDENSLTGGLTTANNKDAEGRSPLWYAVDRAWNFLLTNAPGKAKHIVVLSDSPDTCYAGGDWWTAEDSNCTMSKDVTYTSFKNVVETAIATGQPVIPVSFIQMQSRAYPATDPAQMEMSCLTNGSYRWVNNDNFQLPNAQAGIKGELPDVLERAFEDIRYSLGGIWELDVRAPSVRNADSINPGQIAAFSGALTVDVPGLLVKTSTFVEPFQEIGQEDTRLLVRTTCSETTDCPGGDSLGTCEPGCLKEGDACVHPEQQPLTTNDSCCCGVPVNEPYQTVKDGAELPSSLSDTTQTNGASWQCSYFTETCCTPLKPSEKNSVFGCKYADGTEPE